MGQPGGSLSLTSGPEKAVASSRETDLSTGRDRPGRDDVREHVLILVLLLESRYGVLLERGKRRRQGRQDEGCFARRAAGRGGLKSKAR